MIKKPITNDSGELSELQSGDGLGADYVAINPSAAHEPLQGEIAYNTDEGTLDIGLDNSILRTGQEVLYRVINKTASTITKGSLVMYDGTVGASGKLKVKPWVGGSDPLLIMGVANADIPAEGGLETGLGYVTAFGKVRGIDTTGSPYSESWANGDLIYAGTTSGLTKTKPSAPNTKTIIAAVVNSHASTGELMVRVTLSSSIENDDKVQISSITDKDLLQWNNSTLRFENKSFTAAGFGTIATQNANSVAITGGAIDGTTIGGSTPAAGTFTTLTGNSTSQFGRSSANYFQAIGAAANISPELSVLGSDSNIPFTVESKGTGAINFAAGSRGVNISNGGTVTAITRTAAGTGYTSLPTFTVSAPTTAGGVQATITGTLRATTSSVQSGGTGYTLNDVLTVSGGTFTSAITLTVTAVSGGVITAVAHANNGAYTVLPTNPVSVTGGTGSGATFNVSDWGVNTSFTITNAGSGYVEQPTVTFSGGGGSGAAAYATVGSGTTVKSIGSTMSFNTPGGEPFRIIDGNASASTYWSVIGSSAPYLRAAGGNSSIIENVGAVPILFRTNNGVEQFRVAHTASAVNYWNATGSANTKAPILSVVGSDSNISQVFQTKGTGAIDLAAGSSGVNISNGGTVTAITRTAGGTGYTFPITGTISAPTTAIGVQATLSVGAAALTNTITSGGTGYTVNDVLTLVGGTSIGIAQTLTVTSVSGGVITGVSISNFGSYTTAPANPVSVTGGTGSGATFTLSNWGYTQHTITNAGSGYVEQPTVTFSGGGGSGAAAYATVGGGTTVRSLGASYDIVMPNQQISFRVQDYSGSAGTGYWTAFGGNTTPILRGVGATAARVETASAVPIQFMTNSGTEQFRVAHTASAVNYVQVTGAVTTVNPVISAQGSDTNINLALQAKGNSAIIFRGGNGGTVLLVNGTTSTGRNYLTTTSSASGSAPIFGCDGGDTNIDLALTPKGTGVVKELVGSTYYNVLSQYDVGTAADQVPLNQYLGANAYVDSEFQALDVGTGISTGTGTICKAHAAKQGGLYTIRIIIDLTGLNSGGTANDIIGVNDTALPCYIARLPNQVTVLGGRMTCLETPAGGDTDIDLYSATEGTGVEDADVTTLTETLLINAGTQSVGTVTYFSADPGVNQYLYLAGQSTSNATYTAGRFLIEIFGV